jgi:hypothetical protein
MKQLAWSTVLAASLLLGACGKKVEVKPPEKVTPVTTAAVVARDLIIGEVAVGTETALGLAQTYDPTADLARRYYVRLPFPVHVARDLRLGQSVTLTNFADEQSANGAIKQILPALNSLTQTVDVIVEVSRPGRWRPQGSVKGELTLGTRKNALVVPEQAVVLRQTGAVVYVPEGDTADERAVKQGLRRDGVIEILEGVKAGESVVVDGASLLSGGAKIKRRDDTASAPTGKQP